MVRPVEVEEEVRWVGRGVTGDSDMSAAKAYKLVSWGTEAVRMVVSTYTDCDGPLVGTTKGRGERDGGTERKL